MEMNIFLYWLMWAGMWTFICFSMEITTYIGILCILIFTIPLIIQHIIEHYKYRKEKEHK